MSKWTSQPGLLLRFWVCTRVSPDSLDEVVPVDEVDVVV